MAELSREHGDLPAMVRVVGDQVTDERDDIGLEVGNFTGRIVERLDEEIVDCGRAGFESSLDFRARCFVRIEFCGMLGGFVGSGKPHQTDMMNMSGDAGDGAAFAGGGRSLPGDLRDVAEEKLVGLLVDRKSFEERFAEVEGSGGLGSGGWDRRHVESPDGKEKCSREVVNRFQPRVDGRVGAEMGLGGVTSEHAPPYPPLFL